MSRTVARSVSVIARVVTSVGGSSGQHGRAARVPITTSAAWGRPVQQAGLTDTMLDAPTLSTFTNPTSASLRTWWEQVDWLIPRAVARSPTFIAPAGDVETVCRRRTRVGSASTANHSAYVAAAASSRSARAEEESGPQSGAQLSS